MRENYFIKLISQNDAQNNYIQMKLIFSSFSCNFEKKTPTASLVANMCKSIVTHTPPF